MDSLTNAAALALAAGDPLAALKRVGLRGDPPALALRGIAMAQLGDFVRAKELLRDAARRFGAKQPVAQARCTVAEAEIALASRDLGWSRKRLDAARRTLDAHGDRVNAAHARYLEVRRLLLIGRVDDAERALATIDEAVLPPAWQTTHALVLAGIAMRRLRIKVARAALARAQRAASEARIPALSAEVESAVMHLRTPAARLRVGGEERPLLLEEVEALLASSALIVDGCHLVVRHRRQTVSLAKRPLLFVLARALAEAWPGDAPREALVLQAFGSRLAESRLREAHRARLRVEMTRLRAVLRPLADVKATTRGFSLSPRHTRRLAVLARPFEDEHASVLAYLADGESWSSSALALALRASQRTVQRALESLAAKGKVQSFGNGRTRRWMTPPLPGFTATLLLPAPLLAAPDERRPGERA